MNMRNLTQIKITLYMLLAALLCAVVLLVLVPRGRSGIPYNTADGQERVTEPLTDTQKTEVTQPQEDVAVSEAAAVGQRTETGGAQYRLVEADGFLWVYLVSDDSLYMETGISFELLPSAVQTQIRKGKYFGSDTALYEFLESYSS